MGCRYIIRLALNKRGGSDPPIARISFRKRVAPEIRCYVTCASSLYRCDAEYVSIYISVIHLRENFCTYACGLLFAYI